MHTVAKYSQGKKTAIYEPKKGPNGRHLRDRRLLVCVSECNNVARQLTSVSYFLKEKRTRKNGQKQGYVNPRFLSFFSKKSRDWRVRVEKKENTKNIKSKRQASKEKKTKEIKRKQWEDRVKHLRIFISPEAELRTGAKTKFGFKHVKLGCNLPDPLQESFGPFGPEKRFLGPTEVTKGWKRLKKGWKRVERRLFLDSFLWHFSTFFSFEAIFSLKGYSYFLRLFF